tara:strand:+ start:12747 stop:13229 length:483 start_codon:yes stop_codon:yes gene_type:complete
MNEPTEKFSEIVREYCTWSESLPLAEIEEVKKAISLLVNIYAGVLAIPNDNNVEDIDGYDVSDEEWKIVFKRFGALPFNFYAEFYSPYKGLNEEPSFGDLADDLADIYRDLKEGLALYDDGHVSNAFWQWRYSFSIHWGRHAANALSALHAYANDHGIDI